MSKWDVLSECKVGSILGNWLVSYTTLLSIGNNDMIISLDAEKPFKKFNTHYNKST